MHVACVLYARTAHVKSECVCVCACTHAVLLTYICVYHVYVRDQFKTWTVLTLPDGPDNFEPGQTPAKQAKMSIVLAGIEPISIYLCRLGPLTSRKDGERIAAGSADIHEHEGRCTRNRVLS